ncbi:furin-like protease 1, isoforms 1/1-X/2 isoform X1 [Sitophilus oryzae]|uniref:furin n=1 Tax=Sitophilus oryzae TaxID=7048 RepID=A0A6J2YG61_SITOR|nr:furin-like protease 1, isoforms 1/1-X/2 isoform X1 [Sitophilus oryzae]
MTMTFYLIVCVVTVVTSSIHYSYAHYTQQWAVHIPGGAEVADQVASDHGFVNHGLIFEDHYFLSHSGVKKRSLAPNPEKKARLAVDTRVQWASQQKAKRRAKRDLKFHNFRQFQDPKWQYMWYLNRGGGLDMNVIPVWLDGITGKGSVVTILDDGLEKDHPDLIKNYDPMASYDINSHDSDPSPRYDMIDSNRHGTRCAGEVAATSNNSVCALGVAYGAQVGGVRMLDGDVTDAVEARSLSLNPQYIDIYSASWGPDDDGKTVDGPGELATRAFIEGVTKGRKGKGSIFIWASGNGGRDHDNCNCDGYTNSIYSLSISSATEHGNVPWYSEACSSTLASTYSSGAVSERQVVTTDLRHSCTSSHTGTSASAPLAAGICALVLEANPNLTWRDMQHIVVRTARPQHLIANDWQVNGVGRNVSHSFGYGLMDAYAMVKLAKNWITVPEQRKCEIGATDISKPIPAKGLVALELQVSECEGVEILEHVQAKLTIFAQRRGDLNIELTSPMGTRVTLLAHRDNDNSRSGFSYWPFMSVHSWGESPLGTWKLKIHNNGRLMGRATLQNWSLVLYGSKHFLSLPDTNTNDSNISKSTNKFKLFRGFKKNKSKQKILQKFKNQKPYSFSTKGPKTKVKVVFPHSKEPAANALSTTTLSIARNKKLSASSTITSTTTTDFSQPFYAISNNKVRIDDSVVKHYLSFVKNVTITYPVMIPSTDVVVDKKNYKKSQKLKEKSRDINFNHNTKMFAMKTTENPASNELKKADISVWNLTLYGTNTPPAYDEKYRGESAFPETNAEVWDNSIEPSSSWTMNNDPNKKDTLEVEGTENSTASCISFSRSFCLECFPNFVLHNGTCLKRCPEGLYDSANDLNVNSEKNALLSKGKCVPCHYSCRACSGSLDYQCTECYPDAELYSPSVLENYCYPISMMSEVLSTKWYYNIFLFVIVCLSLVFVFLIYFYVKRKPKGYMHIPSDIQEPMNIVDNR